MWIKLGESRVISRHEINAVLLYTQISINTLFHLKLSTFNKKRKLQKEFWSPNGYL